MMKKIIIYFLVIFFLSSIFIQKNTFVEAASCGSPCFGPADCGSDTGGVFINKCTKCYISETMSFCGIPSEETLSFSEAKCGSLCSDNSGCSNAKDGCNTCVFTGSSMQRACGPNPQERMAESIKNMPGTPNLGEQINKIVNYSTGIGGVIAFILIVIGGFQIILSAGNPERVKAGKEMITSAIAGLLLIIFAVFILKLIGVDILKIPGFK